MAVPPPPDRGPALAAGLALVALIMAAGALAVVVLRPSGGDSATCQGVAWDALPDATSLPPGWALLGSSFVADGYSTTLVGPVLGTAAGAPSPQPSASTGVSIAPSSPAAAAAATAPSAATAPAAVTPTVAVRVSCVGASAEDAITRAHDTALAGGATDATFPDLGDDSFAWSDADGTTMVAFRRGEVVVYLTASPAVAEPDLETAATAQDEALATATGGGIAALGDGGATAGATGTVPGGGATPGASGPTDTSSADDTTPHDLPALEAVLPHTVNGISLGTQSTSGTVALGDDASSQALLASLQAMGKTAADLGLAEAFDESGTLDLDLVAYQVKGADGNVLRQDIVQSWLAAGSSGITTSQAMVGGKAIVKVDYGDGGQLDYLYARDDLVIDVASGDPALAAQVLASLP